MTSRAGRSSLGCLVGTLLLAAAAYFGVNVAEPYLRYYRFRDAMAQSVRFASQRTDAQIKLRLATLADSLGLPEDAARIVVRRRASDISVSSEYYERVELPLVARDIFFNPSAEGPL